LPPSVDDARLRRAQAAAGCSEIGLAVGRRLLTGKLTGQAAVARGPLGRPEVAESIESLIGGLEVACTIDEARQLEAVGANLYWNAWAGNPATVVRFARRDLRRVPEHWLRFDSRRSLLGSRNSNRGAERPVNAICNYTFALAAAECRLACVAVGLDPSLGVVHLDARSKASMALDILEPVRPRVEEFVVSLLAERTFRKTDFHEHANGAVRLGIDLRHSLALTMETWAKAAAPWAEEVVHILGASMDGRYAPSAPLTGAKRRQAAAEVKARKSTMARQRGVQRGAKPPAQAVTAALFATCKACGAPLPRGRRRVYCSTCRDAAPGQAPSQRRQRGRSIAAARKELERWRAEHPGAAADPEVFAEMILPGLAKVKLREIIDSCGVSKALASMIRSGRHVPNPRHWSVLATLAGVSTSQLERFGEPIRAGGREET
jgi:CRISPR-associated endonuclease Cas1